MRRRQTGRRVSCGNAGAVESVESHKQASPSFHEPLGNPAKSGEIPTFPQRRRRGRMEKWKTKSRFSTFPPPRFLSLRNTKPKARGRAVARPRANAGGAARHLQRLRKETSRSLQFQAHPALESPCYFRLVSHCNQFSISGSFLDWKMLDRHQRVAGARLRVRCVQRPPFGSGARTGG